MHIAQGVLRAINVNKLTSTGCLFKFWVADWFAQLNNKMDGDLKKIRMIGQYMIEIWKAIGEFWISKIFLVACGLRFQFLLQYRVLPGALSPNAHAYYI